MPCLSGGIQLNIIDSSKHVEPRAEYLRTRVRFPPPPPIFSIKTMSYKSTLSRNGHDLGYIGHGLGNIWTTFCVQILMTGYQ